MASFLIWLLWLAVALLSMWTGLGKSVPKKTSNNKEELLWLNSSHTLKEGENIMFWRPQKVGSSTMLSVLMSYAWRYNYLPRRKANSNSFCRLVAQCALYSESARSLTPVKIRELQRYIAQKTPGYEDAHNVSSITNTYDQEAKSIPFKISLSHEVCNLDSITIQKALPCAFQFRPNLRASNSFSKSVSTEAGATNVNAKVKQIFMVREPLSRAISVYYFWGELYRLASYSKLPSTSSPQISPFSQTNMTVASFSRKLMQSDGNHYYFGSEADVDYEDELANMPVSSYMDSAVQFFNLAPYAQKQQQLSRRSLVLEEQKASLAKLKAKKKQQTQLRAIKYKSMSDFDTNDSNNGTTRVSQAKSSIGDNLTNFTKSIEGSLFTYHGMEATVPPPEIAMEFAEKLPLSTGMPGPSLSWSLFGNSPQNALKVFNKSLPLPAWANMKKSIESDATEDNGGIFPVVVEELDLSLVAASHFLGVSLADMVITKTRKSMSTHPKHSEWPGEVIKVIRKKLEANGEFALYNVSVLKLHQYVSDLKAVGVDIDHEMNLYRALSLRISDVCMNETHLRKYRDELKSSGLTARVSSKLREVDKSFFDNGHVFGFNKEVLCSFDVCGSCEAHALLLHVTAVAKAAAAAAAGESQMNGGKKNLDKHFYGTAQACARAQKAASHVDADTTAGATGVDVVASYCGINTAPLLKDILATNPKLFEDSATAPAFSKCFPRSGTASSSSD